MFTTRDVHFIHIVLLIHSIVVITTTKDFSLSTLRDTEYRRVLGLYHYSLLHFKLIALKWIRGDQAPVWLINSITSALIAAREAPVELRHYATPEFESAPCAFAGHTFRDCREIGRFFGRRTNNFETWRAMRWIQLIFTSATVQERDRYMCPRDSYMIKEPRLFQFCRSPMKSYIAKRAFAETREAGGITGFKA